ncbi:RNA polymerase II holoenzyme cyclin-like subunit [Maudiozyma exigua]|uniref:RNA polymerase II holoenzyme cyclin-like subunit n=1 Tax=Maudiozyma exigua TaxID=34358 RepID=A0A9P7BBI2_MAUEX|nr:RNA polymerase II holoenzyme cyclin-like subunit [Kazachstania exigua]
MSGSYWSSTQRQQWQFTKTSLAKEKQKLWVLECQLFPEGLNIVMDTSTSGAGNNGNTQNGNGHASVKNIPILHRDLHYDKDYNLRIYCYFLIMKLGRRLNIRQVALATAHVYLARFLLRASVREVNLYLLVTTCVYLACKVEECPQYIRSLVSEARSLWPEFIPPDPTKVTEFEFYLIEELDSYLMVHHPYKSMEQIVTVLKQQPYNLELSPEELQNCWSLINDSYINDVHLIYPPHITAMACMFITITIQNNDSKKTQLFNNFMAQSQVDLQEVMGAVQDQITLYDHWDKYHEPWIKFLLHTLYLRNNPANQQQLQQQQLQQQQQQLQQLQQQQQQQGRSHSQSQTQTQAQMTAAGTTNNTNN